MIPALQKGTQRQIGGFMNSEDLRRNLLDDVYAGAAAGLGAMLLDEERIRKADDEELKDIAEKYGYRTERK